MALQHPKNIRNALPTATGIPQNLIDSYTPAGNKPLRLANALPAGIPQYLIDSYIAQGNRPQRIEDALPTEGTIFVLTNPVSGPPLEQQGGWGVVDGIGGNNYALACQTNDGDTSFAQSGDGQGIPAGCEFLMSSMPPGQPLTGWSIHFVGRFAPNIPGAVVQEQFVLWINRQWNGAVFSGGAQVPSGTPPQGTISPQLTINYQDFGFALTVADVTNMYSSTRTTVQLTNIGAGGTPGKVMNFTQVYIMRQ